eukprot:1531690-Amphidinium_carterae.1
MKQNVTATSIMAALLFARGMLKASPNILGGSVPWLRGLSPMAVLDALIQDIPGFQPDRKAGNVLVVHIDEMAMLLKIRGVEDRYLKNVANTLA